MSIVSSEMPKSFSILLPDAPVGLRREIFDRVERPLSQIEIETLHNMSQLVTAMFHHDRALQFAQAAGDRLNEKPFFNKYFEPADTLAEQFIQSEGFSRRNRAPDPDRPYPWYVFSEATERIRMPQINIFYVFDNPLQPQGAGHYEIHLERRYKGESPFNRSPILGTNLQDVQIADNGIITTDKGFYSEGTGLTELELAHLNGTLEILRVRLNEPTNLIDMSQSEE